MGVDIAKFGATCLVVSGAMSSGDFFDGLERHTRGSVTYYRKAGRRVDLYAEEVVVRLEAGVVDCKANSAPAKHPPHEVPELRYDVQWKHGLRTRPVERYEVRLLNPSYRSPEYSPWVIEITVQSRNVPLADHLVIRVLSRESKEMLRLSGKL